MIVRIERFNHNGNGIGKLDGKVFFVPKTIPGDVVRVEVVKEYKNYVEARVLEYLTYSGDRILIECPYYYNCGGCQLMGLSYDKMLEYKRDKVKDILKKYALIDRNLEIISDKEYFYRNKITLFVKDGKLGLYSYNSNNLVSIDECLLVSKKINEVIKVIRDKLEISGVEKILIRESSLGKLLVKFIGEVEISNLCKCLGLYADIIYVGDKLVKGDKALVTTLGEYKFLVSPDSFFQVNYGVTLKLYNQVKEYLGYGNKRVLDLYCGTLSIGIYVSSCANIIEGIEINESAVRDALENIKLNGLNNISVKCGDVGKSLKLGNDYDAVIVDPPRAGLDKRTKELLGDMKCPKIIYISCNPMTLARDLKELENTYRVLDIKLFDMFPNTYHVECVCILKLR